MDNSGKDGKKKTAKKRENSTIKKDNKDTKKSTKKEEKKPVKKKTTTKKLNNSTSKKTTKRTTKTSKKDEKKITKKITKKSVKNDKKAIEKKDNKTTKKDTKKVSRKPVKKPKKKTKKEKKQIISVSEYPLNHHYNAVDVMKFLCSFLIVMIHVVPFNTNILNYKILKYANFCLKNYLCRIAVPFYFVVSGFLLFRKVDFDNLDFDIIKSYCFKILRLLAIWYFLLFVGISSHLWYMGALVLAVLLISYLIKKGVKIRYIVLISFVLYTLGLLGDSYYYFIEPINKYRFIHYILKLYFICFANTRNGVFFGFIYVLMGALFAKKKIRINIIIATLGFIVSMLLMFGEVYLLEHYTVPFGYNMYIFLLPSVFFLFYIVSHINLKDRPIYGKLRVIGMLIFYTHLLVNFFVVLGIKMAYKFFGLNLDVYHFIMTVICTVIFAIIIYELSRTKKFAWLRYTYS